MPYIALQLVGIQAVLTVMGLSGSSNGFVRDLPLLIAFAILAGYTFLAGLRAPALTAFVKDTLIYVMVLVAIFYIPAGSAGGATSSAAASTHLAKTNPVTGKPFGAFIPASAGEWAYATLALGSALALFMYPHAVTGVLASRSRNVIRRNMAVLPAYSLVLGLVALLGYMALASPAVVAGVTAAGKNAQLSVPLLFENMFPSWFAGVGYAAIVIGALVPAAIMSIAAANLFTRNIYVEYFRPDASERHQTKVSQWVSLVVKAGALGFVSGCRRRSPSTCSCWAASGSCRPSRRSSSASTPGGCTAGRWSWAGPPPVYGTVMAYRQPVPGQALALGTSTATVLGHTMYIAIAALAINVVVSVVLTLIFHAVRLPAGADETAPGNYVTDAAPRARRVPVPGAVGLGDTAAES